MENKKSRKKAKSRNSFNQLNRFFAHDDLIGFLIKQRENYKKLQPLDTNNTMLSHFLATITLTLRGLLHTKKVPLNWVNPLITYITTGKMDNPLDNGISLVVDQQEVTEKNQEIKISHHPEVKAVTDRRINISISAKVNMSQIKKFLDDNKPQITKFMDELELPEVKPMSWDETPLAIWIIGNKEHGLTFEEIADKLQKETDQEEVETRILDANDIKNIYYRYKEYLYSPK